MNDLRMSTLEVYRTDIPRGSEKAVGYDYLAIKWNMTRRSVRRILHDISVTEFDDGLVLIRSAFDGGRFYLTNVKEEIMRYRKELVDKAMSLVEPARILNTAIDLEGDSLSVRNRLRKVRMERKMKQTEVVEEMRKEFPTFDVPMLSKLENGIFLPTPSHLVTLARIYGTKPSDLVRMDANAVAAVA